LLSEGATVAQGLGWAGRANKRDNVCVSDGEEKRSEEHFFMLDKTKTEYDPAGGHH
jgi:hypothetical protein